MHQSFKSVLLGIWMGSVVTFTATAYFLISEEDGIRNAPGEVGEVLAGVALYLFIFLAIITVAIELFSQMKKHKVG